MLPRFEAFLLLRVGADPIASSIRESTEILRTYLFLLKSVDQKSNLICLSGGNVYLLEHLSFDHGGSQA